jgi:hypothetical protein
MQGFYLLFPASNEKFQCDLEIFVSNCEEKSLEEKLLQEMK